LLRQAVPDLADGFDCDRMRVLDREFPLDDWRRREADLPIEVPFRAAGTEVWTLVVILLEHQSAEDQSLALRLLFLAVAYWERQWRAWEQSDALRPPLALRPVLPLVVYTGERPWRGARSLEALLGEPSALHAFAPRWQPLFWWLGEHPPADLLASGEEWLQALAVIRVQADPAPGFEAVYTEAMRRLEDLHGRDHVRWYDLMRIVLTWALWRRPAGERPTLLTAAETSQRIAASGQEIKTMANTIAESLIAEGEAKGELRVARDFLREVLETRFGPLPQEVVRRIDGIADVQRLRDAHRRAVSVPRLDDFQL
jgi:hypothetical protein